MRLILGRPSFTLILGQMSFSDFVRSLYATKKKWLQLQPSVQLQDA
jgi:predicted CopG family antitoxin